MQNTKISIKIKGYRYCEIQLHFFLIIKETTKHHTVSGYTSAGFKILFLLSLTLFRKSPTLSNSLLSVKPPSWATLKPTGNLAFCLSPSVLTQFNKIWVPDSGLLHSTHTAYFDPSASCAMRLYTTHPPSLNQRRPLRASREQCMI